MWSPTRSRLVPAAAYVAAAVAAAAGVEYALTARPPAAPRPAAAAAPAPEPGGNSPNAAGPCSVGAPDGTDLPPEAAKPW
jgi:hypothetical protein